MPSRGTELDRYRNHSIANALRAAREFGAGLGDTALTIGTGMAAQPFAGVGGLLAGGAELARTRDFGKAGEAARDTIAGAMERGTWEPRTDVGARGVENVGKGMETVLQPIKDYAVDPIGDRFPAVGAGILGAASVIGPKGKPKLRTEPHSPQGVLPGVEALTKQEALAQAVRARDAARDAASFRNEDTGVNYEYDPESSQRFRARRSDTSGGDRPTRTPSMESVAIPQPTDPQFRHAELPRVVGRENAQRMLAKDEAFQNAQDAVTTAELPAVREEIGAQTQEIQRLRAELAAEQDPQRAVELQREIYHAIRGKPIADETGAWRAPPTEAIRHPNRYDYDTVAGRQAEPTEALFDQRDDALAAQQRALVDSLRTRDAVDEFTADPEPSPKPQWMQELNAENPGREGSLQYGEPITRRDLEERMGVGPDHMNREAVDAFLREAQHNPDILQYGTMPKDARSIEDFAEVFGDRAGKRINVEWGEGESDEPYKIKEEKTHGHNEVMRNEYGDYKEEPRTHDRGDYPMYDESGDVKKVEVKGPPIEGEDIVQSKKIAEGGEQKRDSYGDPQYDYIKSEGGEPMRDERGRIKYEEVENPDYHSGGDESELKLSTGRGHITTDYNYDEPQTTSTGARGEGGLLYQTLLAEHSRSGQKLGASKDGLTSDNKYRLLANVLANWARTGVNPRDVTGTLAGEGTSARGFAKGPEVWRALQNETKQRLHGSGTDPDRLTFDPETGFSINGKTVESGDDIKAAMADLSPNVQRSKVGQKSVMNHAVFQWLRNATPEDAARVAREWGKYGPLFAIGGISLGDLKSMMPEEVTED